MQEPRTTAQRWAMAFMAGFLALQIGVPTWKLAEPRPARFGWQMFSATAGKVEFRVVLRHGQSVEVPLGWHVGVPRADLDFARFLPQHLCRFYPGAAEVRFRAGFGPEQVYRCP